MVLSICEWHASNFIRLLCVEAKFIDSIFELRRRPIGLLVPLPELFDLLLALIPDIFELAFARLVLTALLDPLP